VLIKLSIHLHTMKKLFILSALFLLAGAACLFSQISLTYETHALLPDNTNAMQMTNYENPGSAGANQTWDFSNLVNLEDFEGTVNDSYSTQHSSSFPNADVLLTEFDNQFYFKLSDDKLEQFGFATSNNDVIISYNEPFVKMHYPFTFGNTYTGIVDADYTSCSRNATLEGTYSVEADAYGKLILPNNSTFDSTLRIKTVKSYSQVFTDGFTMNVEMVSYRWYSTSVRFPLLTLTSVKTTVGSDVSTTFQAAYSPTREDPNSINESFISKFNLGIYPNPFDDQFIVTYTIDKKTYVNISLYDALGKQVAIIFNGYQNTGAYTLPFMIDKHELCEGIYYVRSSFDNEVLTNKLIQVK
jgi:hypothetical protein